MANCKTCFDREGVIVADADRDRLCRCPVCQGNDRYHKEDTFAVQVRTAPHLRNPGIDGLV